MYTLNAWIIWYVNYISKVYYFLNRVKKCRHGRYKKHPNQAFLKMKTTIWDEKYIGFD